MDSFEFNKIFAAVLVAGITAMLGGFIAEHLVHAHALEKNAVEIEGVEASAGGAPKEALPEPVLGLIATADVEKGRSLSKACAACHSFDKGGPIKTGPSLWNVAGHKRAGKSEFAYSSDMTAMGGNWSYLDLNKFLWKPKKFMSGTKMNFIGLKKPEDRAAMIAWLRTLSDSPPALPSDSEIAAEVAELAPPTEALAEAAPEVVPEAGVEPPADVPSETPAETPAEHE